MLSEREFNAMLDAEVDPSSHPIDLDAAKASLARARLGVSRHGQAALNELAEFLYAVAPAMIAHLDAMEEVQ